MKYKRKFSHTTTIQNKNERIQFQRKAEIVLRVLACTFVLHLSPSSLTEKKKQITMRRYVEPG